MHSKFFFPAVPGQSPDGDGYFGAFGGTFIPEALVAAVDEVAVEYERAKADPGFAAELEHLLAHYVGRPSALTEVPRFAEHAGGARVFLKREDLNHTGSHKINNVLGQALLTKRMGKPRVIAETGAGQHGVATATACALFGLECTVYMGETDIRRQAVNVARMKMLGATVISVTSGSRTLKDAINETFRDWVANVGTTHYIFGTVAGPHPFPAMIRDFQRVVGVEARRQIAGRTGRLPDAAIACVGGGSNAIGLFHAFLPDTGVRLIGCEAAGHGVATGEHAATLSAGEPGILHGSRSYVLQDDEGQITEPWSISAGLDYPGVGPEHAYLHDTGRGEYRPVTDEAAMRAFRLLASSEGIIPAIESAHARRDDRSRHRARTGRADPGEPVRPGRQGHGHRCAVLRTGRRRGRGRPEVSGNLQLLAGTLARAKQENRAALITYMTAGFPTVNEGIAAIQAMLTSGADIVEVGLPHSDPLLDGPVIQAADDIALRGGVRIADVIRTVREAYQATGKPVLVMSYWNPIVRYGAERFSSELAAAGGAGCILPDLPVQESARWREIAAGDSLATVFLAAPSTTDERLRELTAAGSGFVYAASLMGVTGIRDSVDTAASSLVQRIRAITRLPVCVGIGISNAAQAAQVAGFADGVIVASALVKAILDAPDAATGAAAVAELTAELSRATRRHDPPAKPGLTR